MATRKVAKAKPKVATKACGTIALRVTADYFVSYGLDDPDMGTYYEFQKPKQAIAGVKRWVTGLPDWAGKKPKIVSIVEIG